MGDYPNSYAGDAHEGMNERIAQAMTEGIVDHLADVVKFLKEETTSDEVYDEWAAKNPLI